MEMFCGLGDTCCLPHSFPVLSSWYSMEIVKILSIISQKTLFFVFLIYFFFVSLLFKGYFSTANYRNHDIVYKDLEKFTQYDTSFMCCSSNISESLTGRTSLVKIYRQFSFSDLLTGRISFTKICRSFSFYVFINWLSVMQTLQMLLSVVTTSYGPDCGHWKFPLN